MLKLWPYTDCYECSFGRSEKLACASWQSVFESTRIARLRIRCMSGGFQPNFVTFWNSISPGFIFMFCKNLCSLVVDDLWQSNWPYGSALARVGRKSALHVHYNWRPGREIHVSVSYIVTSQKQNAQKIFLVYLIWRYHYFTPMYFL